MSKTTAKESPALSWLKNTLSKTRDNWSKLSPERFFIICAAVFGLLFIIITPPFQTPDEPVHFYRAYQISELNFIVDENGPTAGGQLPKSLGATVVETSTHPTVQFSAGTKYDIYKTKDALNIAVNPGDEKVYDFGATAFYSPLSYVAQSSGILIGRIISLPPVMLMYLGRAMNLLLWMLLWVAAIRLFPFKKWAVVSVGLLPMVLFQATSLSADVMTMGMLGIFLAYILRLLQQGALLQQKQLLALLCIAVLLVMSKQVMFVFLGLILLLPYSLFATKYRAWIVKIGLIAIPLIIFGAWMILVRDINVNGLAVNHQDPIAQAKFIVTNPHSFINVLWNTYFFTWGDSITRSVIGTFGWMDTPLAENIATIGYLGIAFLLLVSTNVKEAVLGTYRKALIATLMIIYTLVVSAALYLYYSPVGFKIIVGLQGRYFLPLVLLAVPLLHGRWLQASRRAYKNVAIGLPLFLLTSSVITLWFRYYINNV